MLTSIPPIPASLSTDTTNTAQAARVEASARSACNEQVRIGNANETHVADAAATVAAVRQATSEVPDPMTSLSTVAVAGALNSLPAALNMLRNVALASASGTLSDADRQTLQAEYAQLNAKVVGSVGSVGAGAHSQQSTAHDDHREDTRREARGAPPRSVEEPQQSVQRQPVERTVTTQKQAEVISAPGPHQEPQPDVRTHAVHVGADSYEPVSARPSMASASASTITRIESHPETTHTVVAQATQVTQFVEVARPAPPAPVVAVA